MNGLVDRSNVSEFLAQGNYVVKFNFFGSHRDSNSRPFGCEADAQPIRPPRLTGKEGKRICFQIAAFYKRLYFMDGNRLKLK